MMLPDYTNFNELVGKTIDVIHGAEVGSEDIIFECASGERYRMSHYQDCCESVRVAEIVGDVSQLIGYPIVSAEESSQDAEDVYESGTWTFYRITSSRGTVVIRWLGESNGYYSESVDFEKMK